MICPSSTLSITARSYSESFNPPMLRPEFVLILQKVPHRLSSPRDPQPFVQTVEPHGLIHPP